MVWDDADFQSYFRNLVHANEERVSVEAQQGLQRRRAEMARIGAISGVHMAVMATELAGKTLFQPAVFKLEAFEDACRALNMRPVEQDFRSLEAHIEQWVTASERGVLNQIESEYRRHQDLTPPARISQQVAANAVREVRRRIERRILEVRHLAPPIETEGGLVFLNALDDLNRAARNRVGYGLFQTSEYRAAVDILKPPRSPEELSVRIQLLGLLLDQVNQSKITESLERSKIEVPDGSINRIASLMQVNGITSCDQALATLRDVRRLANGYPRHVDSSETLAAAERLAVQKLTPQETWTKVTRSATDALQQLEEAFAGREPKND